MLDLPWAKDIAHLKCFHLNPHDLPTPPNHPSPRPPQFPKLGQLALPQLLQTYPPHNL
jgi:hypothetical protein